MGAGVGHAVARVVVGQVNAVLTGEGELQHLHAGESALRQQLADRVEHLAQILGHDGQAAQGVVQCAEQLHARALLPAPVAGRRLPCRDGPVGVKATEVVDAQDVIDGQRVADAQDPPRIAGAAVVVPVVERVAPQLAVGGKVVRRAACNAAGLALSVCLKQLTARPGVSGVGGDINGNIAHDGDALLLGVGVQGAPLAVKLILQERPELDLPGVFGLEFSQRLRLTHAQGAGPLLPVHHAVGLLDGHVQAVVGQPVAAQKLEAVPVVGVGRLVAGHRALFQEVRVGFAQHSEALFVEGAVVHMSRVAAPVDSSVVLFGQQAVGGQQVQINKVGVAREGGAALVRAVGVAGGADGQNLPDGLPGLGQKVHKVMGRLAHAADAIPAGQTRDRHQNAAAAFEFHSVFPLLCICTFSGSTMPYRPFAGSA